MVLRGHHHVLHAGGFGEPRPATCKTRCRIEYLGERRVLAKGNCFSFHSPFVASMLTIKAKVDEHTKLGFMPPTHTADLIGRRRNRRGRTFPRYLRGRQCKRVSDERRSGGS